MNSVTKPLSKSAACAASFVMTLSIVMWTCLSVAVMFFAFGCTTTVRPKTLKDSTPSPDGSAMSSGIVDWFTNASGVISAVITPHMRDRYNAMIPIYGTNFLPSPKFDEGVTPFTNGTFLIDDEHLFKLIRMNRVRKGG